MFSKYVNLLNLVMLDLFQLITRGILIFNMKRWSVIKKTDRSDYKELRVTTSDYRWLQVSQAMSDYEWLRKVTS